MTRSGVEMFRRSRPQPAAPVEFAVAPADPLRAFADWAMQRAEGICWMRAASADDAFAALADALPELRRSGVRWSGAGVLHQSRVEWFAFAGDGRAVLVFALDRHRDHSARQLAALDSLARHGAFVVAGGSVPAELDRDLAGLRGVPVWELSGFAAGTGTQGHSPATAA